MIDCLIVLWGFFFLNLLFTQDDENTEFQYDSITPRMRGDSNTRGLLLKALAYFFSLEKDLSIHVYVFSDV